MLINPTEPPFRLWSVYHKTYKFKKSKCWPVRRSNFSKIVSLQCQRLHKPFFAFYCSLIFLLLPLYGEMKIFNMIGWGWMGLTTE